MHFIKHLIETFEPEESPRERKSFWASDAEVCARSLGYDWTKEPVSNPVSLETELVFSAGKSFETALVDRVEKLGLVKAPIEGIIETNAKDGSPVTIEYQPEKKQWRIELDYQGVKISGNPDLLLTEKSVVEIKSFYGVYYERELDKDCPKSSYVAQTAFYMFALNWNTGHLIHLERGTGRMITHDVKRLSEYVYQAGMTTVNLQDIFERYKVIKEKLDAGEIPERQYVYKYDIADIPEMMSKGLVSKSKVQQAQRGHLVVGDWQCKYCKFKDKCVPELGYTDDEMAKLREIKIPAARSK